MAVPRFKLYASNGSSLLYTFLVVQATNIPQSPTKSTVIEGHRGIGCVIVPGSESSWDMTIRGFLLDDSYTDVTTKITALESTVAVNTPYVLTFDQDEVPTLHWEYNVKRIEPIEYPESLRTDYQEYVIKLKVNAW